MHTERDGGKRYVFDDPRNVRLFIRGFFAICGLLLLLDLFIPRHGEYPWEGMPEFYAAYGLVSCVVLVLVAKYVLRPLARRDEDYYDR